METAMRKIFLLLPVLPLVGACVAHTYEKETLVEPRPSASTVVVPQGTTAAPPSTTVVVPQSSPPPSRETTIVVPR
jgi:hypothetical protein